jgi:phosphoketolase
VSLGIDQHQSTDVLVSRVRELDEADLAQVDAWWRANNYLAVGQIYLQANPLLREPLRSEHIKPRLLGHWGTSPGLSFLYAHRFHVRGFIEEGSTTTPFDLTVRNKASRFHLVIDALNNARRTPPGASALKAWCEEKLAEHEAYVVEHLEDLPEIANWTLPRLA